MTRSDFGTPGVREVITPALRHAVLLRDGGTCRYCGSSGGGLHLDHVIPVKIGGRSTYTNLVTACSKCNLRKGVSLWKPLACGEHLKGTQETTVLSQVEIEDLQRREGDNASKLMRSRREAQTRRTRTPEDWRRINGL